MSSGGSEAEISTALRGLHFNAKTESAFFEADMGGSDPDVAVPLLLRLLEGFNDAVLAIEAVVVGRGA